MLFFLNKQWGHQHVEIAFQVQQTKNKNSKRQDVFYFIVFFLLCALGGEKQLRTVDECHTLWIFVSCPSVSVAPSAVAAHPPETSASACCLVLVFSAMIKVSFWALGLLITYSWLRDESQGGSWLRTLPFLVASLEVIGLKSSPPDDWSIGYRGSPGVAQAATKASAVW